MDEQEYNSRREKLLARIAFNKKIHCPLVAARIERELNELDKYYEQHKIKEDIQ